MVEYVATDALEPHELNEEIYTNRNIDELVSKIDAYGFQESQPLLITDDDTILSGHRRWRAARELGVEKVPVRRVDAEDQHEQLFTLLIANKYRDKTAAEKINEAEAWERIEREKAAERNAASAGASPQKLAETQTGEAKAKAAEKVGASKETVRKGQKVKEKAKSGDETAQREWKRMESGDQSVHGAYSTLKREENSISNSPERDPSEPDPTTPQYEWVHTEPKDIEIQARDCDTDGKYMIHVNGDDYRIKTELYSKLFADNP